MIILKDITEPTTEDGGDYWDTYNIKDIYQAMLKVTVKHTIKTSKKRSN